MREYLSFAQNELGVAPEEIHYLSQSPTAAPPTKISPVMFFCDGRMAVIEDVAAALGKHGSPAYTMKIVSRDAIRKAMYPEGLAKAKLINLISGQACKPAKGEIIAVILMGQEMSDIAKEYLAERAALEKRTHIKTFVVTVDENDITEIVKRRVGTR